jgi:hypothetical protein
VSESRNESFIHAALHHCSAGRATAASRQAVALRCNQVCDLGRQDQPNDATLVDKLHDNVVTGFRSNGLHDESLSLTGQRFRGFNGGGLSLQRITADQPAKSSVEFPDYLLFHVPSVYSSANQRRHSVPRQTRSQSPQAAQRLGARLRKKKDRNLSYYTAEWQIYAFNVF